MGLSIVTQPSEWPLSLDEAKTHLRVRHDEEDSYITDLVASATTYLEGQFDLQLARREYRLTLDAFSDTIELPRKPVAAVTSVKYFDEAGVEQTLDPAVYTADLESSVQWVLLNEGQAWPTLMTGVNTVSITFTTGFLPANTPPDTKQAIRMLVGHWYSNRETVVVGSISGSIPFGVQAIIESLMVPVG